MSKNSTVYLMLMVCAFALLQPINVGEAFAGNNINRGVKAFTVNHPGYDPDWDWTTDQQVVLYLDSQPTPKAIHLPYYASSTDGPAANMFADSDQTRDMLPEEGWVCLIKNFGYDNNLTKGDYDPNDPDSYEEYINYPYFILYNQYRSLVRIFYYLDADASDNFDYNFVKLEHDAGLTACLSFGCGNMINTIANQAANGSLEFTSKIGRGWNYAEFTVGFDPNPDNYSRFAFDIHKIDEIDIELVTNGTLEQYFEDKDTYDFDANLGMLGSISGGNISLDDNLSFIFKNAGNLHSGLSDIFSGDLQGLGVGNIGNLNIGSFWNSIKNTSISTWSSSLFLPGFGTALSGISGVMDYFIGNENSNTQQPLKFAMNLNSTGTITDDDPIVSIELAVPGAMHATNEQDVPFIDNMLGVFNLVELPTLYYDHWNNCVKPPDPQTEYDGTAAYCYALSSGIEIELNSNAGIIKKVEAALINNKNEVIGADFSNEVDGYRDILEWNHLLFGDLDYSNDWERDFNTYWNQDGYSDLPGHFGGSFEQRIPKISIRVTVVPPSAPDEDHAITLIKTFSLQHSRVNNWLLVDAVNGTWDTSNDFGEFSNATNISSNQTWSGSIFVEGTLTINNNATLTIEEGTNIFMGSGAKIYVYGGAKILAEGTFNDPIRFKRREVGNRWGCVRLMNDDNEFDYCVFDGGYQTVMIEGDNNSFANCTFKNGYYGIYSYGNSTQGYDGAQFLLKYSRIEGNTNGIYAKNTRGLLFKNTIRGNTNYGIYCYNSAMGYHPTAPGGTYGNRHNLIEDNGTYGIYLRNNSQFWLGRGSTAGNNRICNNGKEEIRLYGTGVRLYGGSNWNAGGRNDIYDERDTDNTYYLVNNLTSYVVFIEDNYWGTDNPDFSVLVNGPANDINNLNYFTTPFGENAGNGPQSYWNSPIANIPQEIADTELGLPDGFVLKQNYPNPFNPTTTIPFTISATSSVVFKVYNVNGQLVGTLTDGIYRAGIHKLEFDGRNLSNGIYFVRARVNELDTGKSHHQIIKMLLVK